MGVASDGGIHHSSHHRAILGAVREDWPEIAFCMKESTICDDRDEDDDYDIAEEEEQVNNLLDEGFVPFPICPRYHPIERGPLGHVHWQ
jgi:hypothetical protein